MLRPCKTAVQMYSESYYLLKARHSLTGLQIGSFSVVPFASLDLVKHSASSFCRKANAVSCLQSVEAMLPLIPLPCLLPQLLASKLLPSLYGFVWQLQDSGKLSYSLIFALVQVKVAEARESEVLMFPRVIKAGI